jgi:DNA-binding MarR family transcriptional regulator
MSRDYPAGTQRTRHLDRALPQLGVRPACVARLLVQHDGLALAVSLRHRTQESRQRELAAKLGVTMQGAAKLAGEMERSGYLEKHPDPSDARGKVLRLSARGREAVAEARRFHQLFENRLAQRYGSEAVAAMRAVLTSMARDNFAGTERNLRQL